MSFWLCRTLGGLTWCWRRIAAVSQFHIIDAAYQLRALSVLSFVGFNVQVTQVENVLRALKQHGCQNLGTLVKDHSLNPLSRAVSVIAFLAVVVGQCDIANRYAAGQMTQFRITPDSE